MLYFLQSSIFSLFIQLTIYSRVSYKVSGKGNCPLISERSQSDRDDFNPIPTLPRWILSLFCHVGCAGKGEILNLGAFGKGG